MDTWKRAFLSTRQRYPHVWTRRDGVRGDPLFSGRSLLWHETFMTKGYCISCSLKQTPTQVDQTDLIFRCGTLGQTYPQTKRCSFSP
jgi:hypothetical protein